jgi:hypothetical protein
MNTYCGKVLRTSSPRIQNYADSDGQTGTGGNFRHSHAATRHIHMTKVITQQHKLRDSRKVKSNRFNVQFRLQYGSLTRGHKPAGDGHNFLFFHMRPANQQPTITGVELSHRNVGRPWFTKTRVIRCQPSVLVHNARFDYECYTNHKGSNQTCASNINPLRIYSTLIFPIRTGYALQPRQSEDRYQHMWRCGRFPCVQVFKKHYFTYYTYFPGFVHTIHNATRFLLLPIHSWVPSFFASLCAIY